MAGAPNILWICTDQQRFDTIRSLGNVHINTPNLDRLVSEGVSFTNTFAQSPVCSPSRASFLTGRYPRTTGCRQNGQKDPPYGERLVTKILAAEGYDCGLVGKLHLSACEGRAEKRMDDGYRVFHWSHHPYPDWPENEYIQWLQTKGYDWDQIYRVPSGISTSAGVPSGAPAWAGVPEELHQTTWCVEKAIDFIQEERRGPWLMSVNIFDPHHPFDPPAEYLRRYPVDSVPDPRYTPGELDTKPIFQRIDHEGAYGGTGLSFARLSERERRQVVAAYYAMIELIDAQIGRLLKALEDTGQTENTIVIFMSDHGEMLGDHGIFCKGPYFYDPLVRVPLILSWPGRFRAGLKSDALVELVDLVPTILEAVGIEIPEGIQGRSFLSICEGSTDPHKHREDVYCEYYNALPFHTRPRPYATMLRDREHKIVVYHGQEFGELYDLVSDPGEVKNLWDDPQYAETKYDLIKRCMDRIAFTVDPLPVRVGTY